jgi:hypothetical protein
LALQAGLKKGGAAKGELVLAIFELANCFRHGWGIEKDPIAAKQVRQASIQPRVLLGEGVYGAGPEHQEAAGQDCTAVFQSLRLSRKGRRM